MHELHLMAQVVKVVETTLGDTVDGKLSTVRLKVSALSHLLAHDRSALQTAFMLAARGTKAEGATLELIPVPCNAWCPQCRRDMSVTQSQEACSVCGGPLVVGSIEPEVVIHELLVKQ
ncbi:MAG: hydrogenase maturation nickel metallochaperone HypA [Nitrospira sp. LK70]|nr:hydrogenase maturation nickel metallochaperone HypA [Nitrospira sp. LK70]